MPHWLWLAAVTHLFEELLASETCLDRTGRMKRKHGWDSEQATLCQFLNVFIGLAKKFLCFFNVKTKDTCFHFCQELYWTTYLPLCSTAFCHFSGNFIITSPQNFWPFWTKKCSKCLLQSSRKLKFFPLRNFVKTEINGHPKVQCLGNKELPSQKHVLLHYPNGKLCFLCLVLDAFCQVLLSVSLIGSSTCWNESLGFLEGAHIIENSLPILP